ncbi:MAG: glycosyltransferase family 9 protein [Flavobacteriales bacterium]
MSEEQPMETTTRVLVIRFSSMGDIILTSPVVRALHVLLDGAVEVHVLTKAAFSDAVTGLDGVARVWTIDRTTAEVEEDLRDVGFHYVVDLHANARSGFVKRALRKGEGRTFDLTVDKRSLDKILLVRTGWDRLGGQHVVERYLDTLKPFGNALERLRGEGDEAQLALPSVAPSSAGVVDVVLALGAAHEGKAVPEDHWSEVVDGLVAENRKVHLIGGPAERDAAARLMGAAGDQVVNACGSSWTETFALLSQANLLVAGDTGAMHAGAAMQVPMVVVWGCTSPALGMGPWRAHPATVELEPEGPERSRPCSRLGDRCRHRTPCIRRVSPQRILVAARHILSQTAP